MGFLPLRECWAFLLSLLVVCIQVQSSYALSAEYCSTQNTGGGAPPNSSIYQSNGLCHDACLSSYAFAIVQGQNCWCSNYAPAAQVSTSKCSSSCPGFPDELCGNEAQALFGYIALNVAPSGTLGAASSSTAAVSTDKPFSSILSPTPTSSPLSSMSASRSSPSTSTSQTTTLAKTSETTQSIEEATSSSSITLPSTSQVIPTTSASSILTSSTPKASSQVPAPVTNVQVVTQSGQIVTQTIVVTPTTPASANQGSRKGGIAPGYVAAAAIAGVLGLIFILAVIWLFLRRREDRDGEKGFQGGSLRDMQRNISVHSKAGLLANRNNVPAINTRLSGQPLIDDGATPVSPMSERRKSQPLIWDQRLNPNALMANDNGSRTSLNTIDDHRDYGRTLQVTNPDPMRTSFS